MPFEPYDGQEDYRGKYEAEKRECERLNYIEAILSNWIAESGDNLEDYYGAYKTTNTGLIDCRIPLLS